MEPITIRFTPTAGDYARVGLNLTWKRLGKPLIALLGFCLCLAVWVTSFYLIDKSIQKRTNEKVPIVFQE